jgi:hypothetical protein
LFFPQGDLRGIPKLGSAGRDPTSFFRRHFQLSVELATNSFPANYFVAKIYERKKSEKKKGINTLLRQDKNIKSRGMRGPRELT